MICENYTDYTSEQEHHCTNVKTLIDYLKTELLMIDDFPQCEYYLNELDEIRKKANKKYWSL